MNNLQMRHLLRFCQKHELDPHLIDNTLTYSENKEYLVSLVPDFDPESRMDEWKAAEEQYLAEMLSLIILPVCSRAEQSLKMSEK